MFAATDDDNDGEFLPVAIRIDESAAEENDEEIEYNYVKSDETSSCFIFLKKTHFSKMLCLIFFLYSSLGCLNSHLKMLRSQVTQVRQFRVFWRTFNMQNYMVSNLIVQYLICYLLKAIFILNSNFSHFIKIICKEKFHSMSYFLSFYSLSDELE